MINIVSKRYWYFALSLLVIIPGLISLTANGLRLSISFTSGSLLEVRFTDLQSKSISIPDIRSVYEERVSGEPLIQTSGADTVLVRSKVIDQQTKTAIEKELESRYGKLIELSFETVGPEVSQEVTRNAALAVMIASVGILLYITIAFLRVDKPYRYGIAAIVAMLHDVAVVVGLASIFGVLFNWEVDALFLTALLTIIGFSVHDTIVVFDRIRENAARRRDETFEAVVNHSIVQTLDRSINTQLTVSLTLLALALFGGVTVRNFIITLMIGVLSGTYSSIFNAAQILVAWETGEVGNFFRRLRGRQATV
ncbi:MAG: protein translocase subunit SecF [Chloroflexi bacterium]|nr:protein translocase subunit SecF [Chloroflexota bacterium]